MKRKLLIVLLAVLTAISLTFGFAACISNTESESEQDGTEQTTPGGEQGGTQTPDDDGDDDSGQGSGVTTPDDDGESGGSGSVEATSGLSYQTNADLQSYSVIGIGEAATTDVVIPSTYNGLPVTGIAASAFSGITGLKSITIPDSVTSIYGSAFQSCTSLTSVTIPDSVTSIGEGAFRYCTSLESITIPDSVTSIGSNVFFGCTSLTSITVDNGNTVYHSSGNCIIETASKTLIVGCKNSIIPSDGNVTSIGNFAFYGCASLTSITIPDSVTSIGIYAFRDCTSLTEICYNATACNDLSSNNRIFSNAGQNGNGITVYIGANVARIPAYLLYQGSSSDSSNIVNIVFEEGSNCKSIGERAFEGCSSLTSIAIPDSVTSIGESAFEGCSSLTNITIPDSVTSIGRSAFYGCTSLTSVTFENTEGWWRSSSSTATSGTSISSSDLADPATAARYLTSTYYNYYWKRS